MTDTEIAPSRKISRRTIIVTAVAAILVLAVVGTGIYFLTRGNDDPTAAGAAGPPSKDAVPAAAGKPTSGGAGKPGSGADPADTGNVKTVAEQAIAAINGHDAETLKKISCDPASVGPAASTPPEARAELASKPEVTGDTATVDVKLTIGDASTTTPLPLRKQNGTWCVD